MDWKIWLLITLACYAAFLRSPLFDRFAHFVSQRL